MARVYDHLAAASTGDEINLVRLFVTPADDAPIERSVDEPTAVTGAQVPTADEEAPITEDGEAYILRTSDLAFEDYDIPRDGVLTYRNIDVARFSVGETAHAKLQKFIKLDPDDEDEKPDWHDYNSGWTTFTLAELEAGLIRLVQTGVNPEGTNSQQVVTFTYDVHSSQNGLQNSGNVFTLTIDGVNDVPTDMQATPHGSPRPAAGAMRWRASRPRMRKAGTLASRRRHPRRADHRGRQPGKPVHLPACRWRRAGQHLFRHRQ